MGLSLFVGGGVGMILDVTIEAGNGYNFVLKQGQTMRIIDVEGNQSADTMVWDYENPKDHYSASYTISRQKNIYLTTGTVIYSETGKALLEITDDTTGKHDTLGGCCSAQCNTVRHGRDKEFMHNCRDTFMYQMTKAEGNLNKRDMAPNLNFFMNVELRSNGELYFDDGISGPGKYVEMRALRDVIVIISSCPQVNNPCNAYNPTPLQVLVW